MLKLFLLYLEFAEDLILGIKALQGLSIILKEKCLAFFFILFFPLTLQKCGLLLSLCHVVHYNK